MFNFKKIVAVGASLVLAAGILAPVNFSNVASAAGVSEISVDEGSSTIKAVGADVEIETTVGKKVVTETIKDGGTFYYNNLIGNKESSLKITAGTETQTIKINKQPKLQAKFDPKTYTFTYKLNGSEVAEDKKEKVSLYFGGLEVDGDDSLLALTAKGAVGTASYDATSDRQGGVDSTITQITPASKEIKVKVPAKKAGPKVTIDPNTLSIKIPAKCEYEVYKLDEDEPYVSGAAATQAKVHDLATIISKTSVGVDLAVAEDEKDNKPAGVGTTTQAAIIKVYKAATDKVMQSNPTVIKVPTSMILDDARIDATAGIVSGVAFDKAEIKVLGITLTNKSSEDYEYAILPKGKDVSKIDLTAKGSDKVKFATIKAGKTIKVPIKKAVAESKIVFRTKGVKANAKKNVELVLASQPKVLDTIVYPAELKSVTVSAGVGTASGTTASGTAVKVTKLEGNEYANAVYKYEFLKKAPKKVSYKAPTSAVQVNDRVFDEGYKMALSKDDAKKTKKVLIVYAIVGDRVVGYGTASLSESSVY